MSAYGFLSKYCSTNLPHPFIRRRTCHTPADSTHHKSCVRRVPWWWRCLKPFRFNNIHIYNLEQHNTFMCAAIYYLNYFHYVVSQQYSHPNVVSLLLPTTILFSNQRNNGWAVARGSDASFTNGGRGCVLFAVRRHRDNNSSNVQENVGIQV